MLPFIHLHVHSQYSLLDGQAPVKGIVDKAIANGMRGVALTDHGNMFGIKELHDYVNKKNADVVSAIKEIKKKIDEEQDKVTPSADVIANLKIDLNEQESKLFKPIFGCEAYVANTDMRSHTDKRDIGRHLILLAKNEKGYHNLIKIVSRAWTDGFYSHPRTDHAELAAHHEGVICCSACLGGEVPQLIMNGDINGAREVIKWYKSVFGDDYYLELQRHKATVPNANHETFQKQQEVNAVLLQLSKELGVKVVCSNDSHFLNEDDADAHERLVLLSTGRRLGEQNTMAYTKQEWFKTQEEMNELFADVPEALQNTMEILDKVEIYSINHAPILPDFPLPDGFDNEDDYLRHLVYEGAKERWPNMDDEHRERIDFELETIKKMGFPGYFLIVQDYIRVAPSLGCSVGPGRGSAAGSAVAYCLGITKIDPIKYDLLFERFLNPDRISLPDIDVDFDDDGRAAVLKYVTEKYGAEKVAHIITYGTMAAKMAIKDVARVHDLPIPESNRLAGFIPSRPNDMPEDEKGKPYKITIKNCLKCFPEFRHELDNPNHIIGDTIRFAEKLEGNVRGTGVHACGVIIGRDDITDWVPVSTAIDKEDKDGARIVVTQYEGSVIEETGLIKMDFLGLKTLSELKEACANIKRTQGIDVDLDTIPIDDPKTYELYQQGRTIGTFQFESSGMQKYLRELHPTVFEDLIAMNALYRPGPMDYIPSFIARKNGREEIKYDIPCMEKYLKDTYGITVYQEQVMLLSRQLADFTRGQSDALRKAMGKKKKDIVDAMKPMFIEGGKKNGHDPQILEKIWADWEKFASYAFNKSHAACYSWVAYQTAYLKANYPAEFMAAIMSRRRDQITEITKLMDECKQMKIDTLGPDVNESYEKFGVNHHGQIRFGLGAIKGMGDSAAQAIIAEREANGPFKSIYDFAERVSMSSVNRKAFESLALSGGFDGFGIRREDFFATNTKGEMFLDTLVRYGQLYQQEKAQMQNSLFGAFGDGVEIAQPPVPKSDIRWSDIERLNKERELVGIYLSAHPLDEYKIILDNLCNAKCADLADITQLNGRDDAVLGGIVTAIRTRFDKRGLPCGFVTLEDFDGSGELALFGDDWGRWNGMFTEGASVYLTAKLQPRFTNSNQMELKVQNVEYLQRVKEKALDRITISMVADRLDDQVVADLNEIISSNPGKTKLFFQLRDSKGKNHVLLRSKTEGVDVRHVLIDYIESHDILDYQIN